MKNGGDTSRRKSTEWEEKERKIRVGKNRRRTGREVSKKNSKKGKRKQ